MDSLKKKLDSPTNLLIILQVKCPFHLSNLSLKFKICIFNSLTPHPILLETKTQPRILKCCLQVLLMESQLSFFLSHL